jgi:hypothetical protein
MTTTTTITIIHHMTNLHDFENPARRRVPGWPLASQRQPASFGVRSCVAQDVVGVVGTQQTATMSDLNGVGVVRSDAGRPDRLA